MDNLADYSTWFLLQLFSSRLILVLIAAGPASGKQCLHLLDSPAGRGIGWVGVAVVVGGLVMGGGGYQGDE